jgi:F-type H+-transporting ATPase subunit gamma
LFIFGRKAASYYRKRGRNIVKIFPVFHGRLKADFYQTAYNGLTDAFFKGDVSEVYVAYARFVNAMKNEPKVEKLLSVDVPPSEGETAIVESGSRGIMSDILPMYVSNRLRLMFLESLTSEYSSRMVAMKGAKENAKDLIGDLTLLRNKIRQAAITKEVIEIISSSEALKG